MSMLRSMDSAVSGLRNHQVRMDIIGNNIANVNTVGFKSGRVTFEEALSQLLQGPTRPPGDTGGTNPIQIGLGMSVGSIDMRFTQGNLESTGQVTDLAIEGNSFFAVNNGIGNFYTRNGAFQLDSQGKLVLPTNGFTLQGKMADAAGNFPPGTIIQDITVPLNEQSPASATEEVILSKNLDADSMAQGTVHYSQSYLHHTQANDLVTSLRNSNGIPLNIQPDDQLTFTAEDPISGNPVSTIPPFSVHANTTIQDLTTFMQNFLRNQLGIPLAMVEVIDDPNDSSRGAITIHNNLGNPVSNVIRNFQVTSNNPQSTGEVTRTFAVASTIPNGSPYGTYKTDFLRSPAAETDPMVQVFDEQGNALGLENDDPISFNGAIGEQSADNVVPIIYNDGSTGTATTIADILQHIKDNFRLPESDGTIQDNPTVSINAGGTYDNIPDGAIVIRGIAGKSFGLGNISIRAENHNSLNPSPSDFNRNMTFTQIQNARDPQVFDTSITVFDESGDDHILTMTFVPTQEPGLWQWHVSLLGDESPLAGSSGELIFDQDGTVASFSFDDNATEFSFDPNNGSNIVRIRLDVGGPGNFQGLTQFRSPTTATITGQNGYTTGSLREISIGENGVINGIFTNGVNKALAQIMLVDFINPNGLMKLSDSVFVQSPNSGDPIFIEAGDNSSSTIKPGALEISNVELAAEFTEMITTQRGYQANARAITVSDSLLDELVNLKR